MKFRMFRFLNRANRKLWLACAVGASFGLGHAIGSGAGVYAAAGFFAAAFIAVVFSVEDD